ncbi:hypothetical protein BJV74DRAFT_852393 [Russula compacta]|nr:hypothetical protein BJV74DRAFT_852393 [Russula compacta]
MAATTTHPTSAEKMQAQTDVPPSHTVDPDRIYTVPEQATTGAADGTRGIDIDPNIPNTSQPTTAAIPVSKSGRVPWKDQVVAFAKKTRGTLFRKPTLKEHGDQILAGEASARVPTRKD